MDTPTTPSSLSNARILLVEDNNTYRKAVKLALEAAGFEVLEAENGLKGLNMAREMRPELIVSDVYMPEIDGMEMLQQLKNDPKNSDLPVVMLTNVQEEIARAVTLGAREALLKALVSPHQVVDLVNKHLGEIKAALPAATQTQ